MQGFIMCVLPFSVLLVTCQLFICSSLDYESEYPIAYAELAKGLSQGHIKRKFHVVEGGIEQAPAALPLLFSGGNNGKL